MLHTYSDTRMDNASPKTSGFPSPPQESLAAISVSKQPSKASAKTLAKPSTKASGFKAQTANRMVKGLRDHIMTQKIKHLEAQYKELKDNMVEEEHLACKYREEIAAYSDYFKGERERMTNIFKPHAATDPEAKQIIDAFNSTPTIHFQNVMAALIDRLMIKYPNYQIVSAGSLGKATDTAICTMEVLLEDAEMLREEIKQAEKDSQAEDRLQEKLRSRLQYLQQIYRTGPSSSFTQQ